MTCYKEEGNYELENTYSILNYVLRNTQLEDMNEKFLNDVVTIESVEFKCSSVRN
jgi:hypothetical protein